MKEHMQENMQEYMQEDNTKDIVRQSSVNGAAFYSIQAGVVRDVSNTEQLGIVIRYINECEPVEKLTEFIKCPVVTVCQKIIGCLQGLTLDPAQCRAQTYDGAGNMAGVINGCAANFMKIVPQAHYYHCASHSLNLALSKACKVPDVQNTQHALAIFFKYLPKGQRRAEQFTEAEEMNIQRKREGLTEVTVGKVKLLCETRWVGQHTTVEEFREMHEAILDCLSAILNN